MHFVFQIQNCDNTKYNIRIYKRVLDSSYLCCCCNMDYNSTIIPATLDVQKDRQRNRQVKEQKYNYILTPETFPKPL